MVKNTGEAARNGAVRFLNTPRQVRVLEKLEGWPSAVWFGSMLQVTSVQARWRIDDEWWREWPVSRMYYECLLQDGRRVTVFQDLQTGIWYRQRG